MKGDFLFPPGQVYLNFASTGLLSRRTLQAVHQHLLRTSEIGEVPKEEWEAQLGSVRKMLATLISADEDEIALTPNTTTGLHIALTSIPWEEGDNLILPRSSFPSNLYPWLVLQGQVELRFVDHLYAPGLEEAILEKVDSKTRAITVDWVHFLTGYRVDLEVIGKVCRERGIFFVVDAMQGVGALNLDIRSAGVDFFASGGGKWLLSPKGTGFLYIRREILPHLKPALLGWLSVPWASFSNLGGLRAWKPSAARFEAGTRNLPGFYGMHESLSFLLQTAPEERERLILSLTQHLQNGLMQRGWEILTGGAGKTTSGILSARPSHPSAEAVYQSLQEKGIFCSLRDGWIRFSPHFVIEPSDIDTLFTAL